MKRTSSIRERHGRLIAEGDFIRTKYGELFRVYQDNNDGTWRARDRSGHHSMALSTIAPYSEMVSPDDDEVSGFQQFIEDDSGGD